LELLDPVLLLLGVFPPSASAEKLWFNTLLSSSFHLCPW
jgi:hypothetical protein